MKSSLILLAGGNGSRMGKLLPKQFISLHDKPIAQYSLDIFLALKEIEEVIIVCAQQFRHFFNVPHAKFADPGPERQDSVYNGFQMVSKNAKWVTIHDAARPFITQQMVEQLFHEGGTVGAASLANPIKNTLKEIKLDRFVSQTIDRSKIWEIQTPQLIKTKILSEAFLHIQNHGLKVTDDVSLAEIIGHPVKLVLGSYQNIKITTPEDLDFAEWFVHRNQTSLKRGKDHTLNATA